MSEVITTTEVAPTSEVSTPIKSVKIISANKPKAAPQPKAEKATKTTKTAAAKNAPAPGSLEEQVTLTLPKGTRETSRWLVTPKLDGRERWFDKTKIAGFTSLNKAGVATVTLTRAEITYRGATIRDLAPVTNKK